MKILINNIVDFLKADITAGYITIGSIDANNVEKGLSEEQSIIEKPLPEYPYIMVDDGGERTEETDSSNTLWRIYSVVIDFAVFKTNIASTLDDCLDLSSQIEESIKAERNRQSIWTTPSGDDKFDDLVWGTSIEPFRWETDLNYFRGRRVIVEYRKLEFVYDRY
jgi:hypothetical protein